jgi:histidyl-tRNA synthetase
MAELRPVRGTRDFLPEDSRRRRYIEDTAFRCAETYGFGEVSTPILEYTNVFARTLGDTSDIVTKEMYTFVDRSGDSVTMRPENTAGIVRAFITNKLGQQLPLKVVYRGPMFRYERPQKGRLRQFHQIGVECLGIADPVADIEVISLAADILAALGLADTVALEINTLGDAASRDAYRSELVAYLQNHVDGLSEDSRRRLHANPLRILDSKSAGDKAIVAGAPPMAASLTAESESFFRRVLNGLDTLGIPYRVNTRLVRGLDYYCHTTFEFVTDARGAQGTVLAGGRYDGLVEQMGGPPTAGVGWAAGIERLMMLVSTIPPMPRPVAVLPLGDDQIEAALTMTRKLRQRGVITDCATSGSIARRMKWANRIQARYVVILGADEVARQSAAVRDMDSGDQEELALADIEDRLAALT